MESMISSLAARVNLPQSVSRRALDYHRALQAKKTNLGISSTFETVLCLHVAVSEEGQSVDLKTMSSAAGAKSKAHYTSMLQSLETILEINSSLSLQEVGVQVAAPHLLNDAKKILDNYESHLIKTFGQERASNINFSKAVYPCAAFYAGGKLTGTKLELAKLVELSRARKKELLDLGEEMMKVQPAKVKGKLGNQSRAFMDRIMLGEELKEEGDENSSPNKAEKRTAKDLHHSNGEEADLEEFEVWKQGILRKAVKAGFSKYQKFIKT